jgi:hypothetical protein
MHFAIPAMRFSLCSLKVAWLGKCVEEINLKAPETLDFLSERLYRRTKIQTRGFDMLLDELKPLSFDAIEMLGQLFVSGPVWDGNLVSKEGRTELVKRGYAERGFGWQWLTRSGVELAASYDIGTKFPAWRKKLAMS